MKTKLYIIDEDEEYLLRLTKAISNKSNCIYQVEGISNIEIFKNMKLDDNAICLISLELKDLALDKSIKNLMYLTKEKIDNDTDKTVSSKYIYKYQSITLILKQIYDYASSNEKMEKEFHDNLNIGNHKATIISCFSPGDLSICTNFAHKIGEQYQSKCLCLNLTCFPSLNINLENMENAVKLLYKQKYNSLTIESIYSCICDKYGYHSISSGIHNLDYPSIEPKEWLNLITKLASLENYEVILIELDAGIRGFLDILEMSDKVYCFFENNKFGINQLNRFKTTIKLIKPKMIVSKIVSNIDNSSNNNLSAVNNEETWERVV